MLYGISTSFPVLSRLERQVAHALLTRPPLSYPRRDISVRLECVMHAASVHPEPGSNSRLKSLYLSYLLFYCSHLGIVEISWLPSFLSFLVFCTFLSYFRTLYYLSIVVQFSRINSRFPSRLLSWRALDYYSTFIPNCQAFFLSFYHFVNYMHKSAFVSNVIVYNKQLTRAYILFFYLFRFYVLTLHQKNAIIIIYIIFSYIFLLMEI